MCAEDTQSVWAASIHCWSRRSRTPARPMRTRGSISTAEPTEHHGLSGHDTHSRWLFEVHHSTSILTPEAVHVF
jgi:hypothetical protein